MAPLTELISCCIIEKDINDDVFWSWNYPSIDDDLKTKILRKYNLQFQDSGNPSLIFTRDGNYWIHICNNEVFESDKLPKIKQFSLVLITSNYSPEKFELLSKLFARVYLRSGSPVEVVKLFLNGYTTGLCKSESNELSSLNDSNLSEAQTNVKGMIKIFELEIILIYTALLLKKKVIIYHHSLELLLKWIKSFPAIMKHRNVTEYLYPWMELTDDEIAELEKKPFYIVGCQKLMSAIKPELYDLFVNFPAREISISNHAKEALTMTKTHKEIALFMVQLSENQSLSESQVISDIADKTKDLVNQVISLASFVTPSGKTSISISSIKEKKLSPAVENFLINLAIAENLVTK